MATKATFDETAQMPQSVFKIIGGKIPDENSKQIQQISVGEPLMLMWNLAEESGLLFK